MLGRVALFVTIWFVYYIGNYGWLTLAPTLFTDKGYSLADSTSYLVVSGIGFLIGAYATTRLSDRFERKYSIALCALVWAISLLVIGYFVSPAIIIVFGFIASASIGLLVPMMYTYTAEHYPTSARATGVALSDGLGTHRRSTRAADSARRELGLGLLGLVPGHGALGSGGRRVDHAGDQGDGPLARDGHGRLSA
jgi:putative MFS transporter